VSEEDYLRAMLSNPRVSSFFFLLLLTMLGLMERPSQTTRAALSMRPFGRLSMAATLARYSAILLFSTSFVAARPRLSG
jgi:hypothetical protein